MTLADGTDPNVGKTLKVRCNENFITLLSDVWFVLVNGSGSFELLNGKH